ncbi:PIN domain-containing protein [Amycolatopsis aidingensis]|uniref:hypothetical protein n=1 Tax=Amycolatopsis aidingensis TaxID=2842453 RepID=UPI001C0AF0C1|nr:hypothetical protein [Amycolatopsis aidingensis]
MPSLTALTTGEVQRGAQRCRKRGDDPQAIRLEEWLAAMTRQFADHIMPMTDALIAASTRVYNPFRG